MKKIIVLMALYVSMCFVACGGRTEKATAVADTTEADSIEYVDSVAVDSTVCED